MLNIKEILNRKTRFLLIFKNFLLFTVYFLFLIFVYEGNTQFLLAA